MIVLSTENIMTLGRVDKITYMFTRNHRGKKKLFSLLSQQSSDLNKSFHWLVKTKHEICLIIIIIINILLIYSTYLLW